MMRPFTGVSPSRQQRWTGAVVGVCALAALTALALHRSADPPGLRSIPGLGRVPAPAPPAQAEWTSPLTRQCQRGETALVERLRKLKAVLPQRQRSLQIDPSNYGDRLSRDAYGNPLNTTPTLIVLHETVYGIGSAINTFTTHHPHDDDQVSYHVLIGENGDVVRALDPSKRAFGAGFSAFKGRWAVTNPSMSGSVNNFALHLSLETPLDGEDSEPGHSGYSSSQYDALAVVLADWLQRYRIPFDHITTHRHVDLGLERADPRSFDWQALQIRLAALGALC